MGDKPTVRVKCVKNAEREIPALLASCSTVHERAAPTAEDRSISEQMQSYWVNFATHGDPNGAGLPTWPAFTEAIPLVMRIGVDPGPAPIPNQDRLKVLDAYYDWRRSGSK